MADWNETIQSMNKADELLAEITRLRALVAEAEKVIKPFAEESDGYPYRIPDHYTASIYIGDLRAAAQWMEKVKTDD